MSNSFSAFDELFVSADKERIVEDWEIDCSRNDQRCK